MKLSWLVALGAIITTACASSGAAFAQAGKPASLAGFNFGVGIALTTDTGSEEVVRNADIFGGVVRVLDKDDQQVRVMFESHFFFTPDGPAPLIQSPQGTWGYGPFVAFQAGENQIISSIGLGIMIGFKRDQESEAGDAFNIGLGVFVEPNSQVLGDGIIANQPLPAGETEIRYREESQVSWGVITSFSF